VKYLKIFLVLVVLVCIMFFFLGLKSQKGEAKGLVDGRLADCPSAPNCVSSEMGTPDGKRVEPLTGTMDAVRDAILTLGGEITSEKDDYISATFTSKIFKFVDDVEIRPADDGKVHIRSASRVGYSDRGVNKKRVEALRVKLK